MEDNRIIELFFERSEEAIKALSQKYGALCLKLAGNILKSREDAEECVNDAYLGAWNSIPPQRPKPLCTYICRIVRNLSIAKYHANTAEKRNSNYDLALDELENCFATAHTVEGEFDAKETARLIDNFLLTLDKSVRVMFVRRYYFGDSIGDISALCGVSGHNVSVTLSRTRKKLKTYLEKEGISL